MVYFSFCSISKKFSLRNKLQTAGNVLKVGPMVFNSLVVLTTKITNSTAVNKPLCLAQGRSHFCGASLASGHYTLLSCIFLVLVVSCSPSASPLWVGLGEGREFVCLCGRAACFLCFNSRAPCCTWAVGSFVGIHKFSNPLLYSLGERQLW